MLELTDFLFLGFPEGNVRLKCKRPANLQKKWVADTPSMEIQGP